MTTAADVKRLVQPLLARNPDLVLVGRLVVIQPVRHILRGILIDRVSWKHGFRPHWFATFLFAPQTDFSLDYGDWLFPEPPVQWDIDRANIAEEFARRVEAFALPRLRPVLTVDHFLDYAVKGPFFFGTFDRDQLGLAYVHLARGDFAGADAACDALRKVPNRWSVQFRGAHAFVTKMLCPLCAARDRAEIARRFHAWEAETVRNIKLEKLWEPTPLPIELQGEAGGRPEARRGP